MKSITTKTLSILTFAFCILSCTYSKISIDDDINSMRKTFNSPSDVQTSCYWYWITGNLSKEGVINDLKAMKQAGINRAFIGFQGIDDVPRGPIYMQTEEWYDIVHAALKTATEEDIEIGIFNGPGWSQAGGPWVMPQQSMRYLATQKMTVKGGEEKTIEFAQPEGFLENVKTFAFKCYNSNPNIKYETDFITADGVVDIKNMFDDDKTTLAGFERDRATIVIKPNKEDFTLRSILLETETPIRAFFTIKAKRNNEYEEICTFGADRTNMKIEVGYDRLAPIAVAIPEISSNEYLIDIRINSNCKIRELTFSENPIIDQYADKILSKLHQTPQPYWNDYKWNDNVTYSPQAVVAEEDITDLTEYMNGDQLTWNFPEGDWEVVRCYMAPTNVCNAPALDGDGRGLEVDRWNKESLKHHYESFIGEIIKRVPAEDRKTWKVIVCDSYEKATQNYGDDFIEYFKEKLGYDPTPYLLTFNGTVVGSSEKSNRFLWDLRRVIADRLAYDHIGGMRDLAHKDGFTIWLESYGHWGFPGEFLQYGGQSDEVAGEFWSEGTLGDIENRAATSVAHTYGKRKVSSESFTCGGPEFARSPYNMKIRGDKFFTEGINNTLLHLVIAQPDETSYPGMNCWFGNEFNRKNTWYSHLDLFTDYLKRCNYMLQQGNYVADVAYFIGEDAPIMTGITEPALPAGYQFDFINAEVIEENLSANKDHTLSLPHGTQYRLLVLPPSLTMRPAVLKKNKKLLEDGAIILGPKPEKSPSLQDYNKADSEVKVIANELWGKDKKERSIRNIGNGILFTGYSIEEIFNQINNKPDFKTNIDKDIKYSHTSRSDIDIYFIANQTNEDLDFIGEFRIKDKQPELWNPIDGHTRTLPSFKIENEITYIPMKLAPSESTFIVFNKKDRDGQQNRDLKLNYPEKKELIQVNDNWELSLQSMVNDGVNIKLDKLTDLTELDED